MAQVCTGSLGDPVITEDFGNGPTAELGPAFTTYAYTGNSCPDDGGYTIIKSVPDCFNNSWHNVTDHTGNNGNMMMVNASYTKGVFFTQRAASTKLCAGTTYELAAWIVNLMRTTACDGGGIRPNLSFSIETPDGVVLNPTPYTTGDIPPDGIWRQYGTYFTTPSNVTDVIVKIINNADGGCGNDLALDDITFRACGPDITTTFQTSSGSRDLSVCEGDNTPKILSVSAPAGYQNYQWQTQVNNIWQDINGETGASLSIQAKDFALGSYNYRVSIYRDNNIGSLNCRIYSTTSTLAVTPMPEMTTTQPDLIVCEGTDISLNFGGGAKYLVKGPNPNRPPVEMTVPAITNIGLQDDGNYSIAAISAAGCTGPAINFSIVVKPQFAVAATADTRSICAGGQARLLATAIGGAANDTYSYQWSPATGLSQTDIANPLASPTETTTYTVSMYNGACFDPSEITIYVVPPPVASITPYKAIFEGQSVVLDADTTGGKIRSLSWSPSLYLDKPGTLRPLATPAGDITYTLTAVGQCGIDTARVFIKVYKDVVIPNAFSPNGDGVNDIWNIPALPTLPGSETSVYNRQGQRVYHSIGYTKAWNGTYNGKVLPGGSYYYIIDLKIGRPKMTGWVVIMR